MAKRLTTGQVPQNFMPVIIVYDNADTLDFGKAYVSDDAYDGPLSELTYDSTVISVSDRTAWEEFRKSGPKNVVTREKYWTGAIGPMTAELGVGNTRPRFANNCTEAKRFKFQKSPVPLSVSRSSFERASIGQDQRTQN